ncbi:MAG: arginine--tRNA ligase [Methanobacterium sp.]|nr:arginine--tRNA ligase [Methanobacterium sp.]
MYRILMSESIKALEEAINNLGWEVPDIRIEQPPNPDLGDVASSVSFQLAKKLKRSPMDITNDILGVLKTPDIFKRVDSKGPYINFFVDNNKFSKIVLSSINEDYGQLQDKNMKVIVEHTSANPNGPLHIGHIRNSVIGDSLGRVLKSAGYDVETQYYVNDMGRQIAMIVWGILNHVYQMDPHGKPDHEIGKLYFEVNERLRANPDLKLEISALLKCYEKGSDNELEKHFENVVKECLQGVSITSARLNVEHDAFIWESRFIKNGSVARILKDLDPYTEKNEVVYMDLEKYGIEKELILIRSDGTSLYSTRDLAYHFEKFENSDISIDILGSDHKLALDQLGIALELVGAKKPEIIFYEFITLPEGSMSTRKGVFISVDDLMEEAVIRAMNEIEKRRSDLSKSERLIIAEQIGIGAIRYFIARLSPEKHIIFKWDEALSFERGCASIQYSHARACKLLEKANYKTKEAEDIMDLDLEHPFEIELIKIISKFPYVIEEVARIKRVHNIAQYSQDLAGAFNKFYKSVPVIGSDKEDLRLLIVDKSRITIQNCLKLMGIEAPQSM